MGEEDLRFLQRLSLGGTPPHQQKIQGRTLRARAGSNQPPCATSQTDTLTRGLDQALPRAVQLARCPGLFSSAGAVLVGILRGRASRHCSRGSEGGGEREIRGPS